MIDSKAGEYIKGLRGAMSLRRLEELTGISKSYLCRLEKGERHPSPEILYKISEALGCPNDELLRVYGYVSEADFATWRVLGNKLREMSPEQLRKIIETADDILKNG